MLRLENVRRVHVEITTRCNARCPMCMRNYRGLDYNSGYPLCELSLQDFKKIFPPHHLATICQPDPPFNGLVPKKHGFWGFLFNGNLGDFGSARDALEIVKYLVAHQVPISINTNGSIRKESWWSQLALPGVTIGFALDGLADTHALYRQDTDWYKIIANARAFIRAGGRAIWRFIPFEHNKHQLEDCKKMSIDMGFADFENIYDGRDSTPVFTRSGQYSHEIGGTESSALNRPDVQTLLQNHVTWYNKSTVNLEQDQPLVHFDCLHLRNKEIYVAADGSVYPCCFLGFYPSTMNHPGNQELKELVYENNALIYPLEHCLEWFHRVEQSWNYASIAQGRTYQCVVTCSKAKI